MLYRYRSELFFDQSSQATNEHRLFLSGIIHVAREVVYDTRLNGNEATTTAIEFVWEYDTPLAPKRGNVAADVDLDTAQDVYDTIRSLYRLRRMKRQPVYDYRLLVPMDSRELIEFACKRARFTRVTLCILFIGPQAKDRFLRRIVEGQRQWKKFLRRRIVKALEPIISDPIEEPDLCMSIAEYCY